MPRGWGGALARFIGPGIEVLNFRFARGLGNSPIKKIARGFCLGGGGMVRLGID